MTRFDLASALLDYIPEDALEKLAAIGKDRADRHVEMDFKGGRCQVIKVTDTQRFKKDDFDESG